VVIPALIGFVLLLTPTGKLPAPRWRWWARVAAAAPVVGLVSLALGPFREPDQAVANPLAVPALAGPLLLVRGVAFVVAGLSIPVGAWSLVVRFRHAVGWSASSCGGCWWRRRQWEWRWRPWRRRRWRAARSRSTGSPPSVSTSGEADRAAESLS
jgi:hypothetical protein